MAKAQMFENFAYSHPGGNRAIGTPGLIASQQYVLDTLAELDYYDVTTQNFSITRGRSSLSIDGTILESSGFTNAPVGNVVARLVPVSNLGCNIVRKSSTLNPTSVVFC